MKKEVRNEILQGDLVGNNLRIFCLRNRLRNVQKKAVANGCDLKSLELSLLPNQN